MAGLGKWGKGWGGCRRDRRLRSRYPLGARGEALALVCAFLPDCASTEGLLAPPLAVLLPFCRRATRVKRVLGLLPREDGDADAASRAVPCFV